MMSTTPNNAASGWWYFDGHSHSYTTLPSMLISLFTHTDWEHVFSNMLHLWIVGRQLFVPTDVDSSNDNTPWWRWLVSSWTSPLCFLWIYLGSQGLAVVGCRFLSHLLDREWEQRLRRDRATWSWQWVPDAWKDAYYTITNAQQAVELYGWKNTPMIGSSAAVFGVIGAHVYVAFFARDHHPARMDSRGQLIWLVKIGMDLVRTPFSLDEISSLDKDDNIDHASHLCGFVGGMLLAAVWHILICTRK